MDTWTTHMGFPLIRVRLDDRTITVSQERFVMNPIGAHDSGDGFNDSLIHPGYISTYDPEYLWYVPLSYISDLQPKNVEFVWLNKTQSCKCAAPVLKC